MGTGPEEADLARGEHGGHRIGVAEGETLPQERSPFDEVKVDLGAIIVVAVIGAPLVIWQLDGAVEWILLSGYGCGAALWIYCRTRGVLAAAHASRVERTGLERTGGS